MLSVEVRSHSPAIRLPLRLTMNHPTDSDEANRLELAVARLTRKLRDLDSLIQHPESDLSEWFERCRNARRSLTSRMAMVEQRLGPAERPRLRLL